MSKYKATITFDIDLDDSKVDEYNAEYANEEPISFDVQGPKLLTQIIDAYGTHFLGLEFSNVQTVVSRVQAH